MKIQRTDFGLKSASQWPFLAICLFAIALNSAAANPTSADLMKSAIQAEATHDFDRAKDLYQQALKSDLKPADEGEVSARLASCLVRSGRSLDAQPHTQRAIAIARKLKEKGDLQHQLAYALVWLGESYGATLNAEIIPAAGQTVTSEQAARNNLALVELVESKNKIASARATVALVQTQGHQFREAETTYGQIVRDLQGEDPKSGVVLIARIRCALLQKKNGKVKEGTEAIEQIKHDLSKTQPEASTLLQIADAQVSIQDPSAGIETYKLALRKINKGSAGANDLEANAYVQMARIYYGVLKQSKSSEDCYRHAIQILSQPGGNRDSLVMVLKGLATLLKDEKRTAEADKVLAQARQLSGQNTQDSGKWLVDLEKEASKKDKSP